MEHGQTNQKNWFSTFFFPVTVPCPVHDFDWKHDSQLENSSADSSEEESAKQTMNKTDFHKGSSMFHKSKNACSCNRTNTCNQASKSLLRKCRVQKDLAH